MRTEQLEYLAAVTRYGSLRRASDELHVSQSALSAAIRSLEHELGVPLLERRRAGAKVSREGGDILPIVTEILGGVAELRAAASAASRASRTIRVGTVHAGTSALLVPAVRSFATEQPTTTVDVATMFQSRIHERLLEGRLEIGLVNMFPGDDVPTGLTPTPLLLGRPAVCCRTDDPLAAKSEITAADLRERPFVSSRPGYLMHRLAQRLFGDDHPVESFRADGAEMVKLLVANGVGPSLLPDYSIHGDPLVEAGVITARPLAGALPRVAMLLLRRTLHRVPASIAAFERTIVRIAQEHPQSDVGA
ncbi:DNA-binding transcriptional regulator, LysR family [Jatrophihabitans endophyticus]|uniref:DNA-binding transcriptional regulator, LysR family n=1 Tax=Jatrophihabitans endophyticus TaxID=1206085 RepID=A0A1M5DRM3_9ACTN|nr:LysR family transcriptional regulator [Jatrophihabitans endophyticus]SHF69566.1 DNA-binding transcriptional regulator, LysR family [Jatrophihabitans endophyticus]